LAIPARRLAPVAISLMGLTLAACAAPAEGETPATASADPAATPSATAVACEVELPSGESTLAVAFDGVDYDVRVFVPEALEPGSALVLDLHGSSSNGVQQAEVSGLDAVAEAEGFIAVQPVGVIEAESYAPMPDGSWAWNVPGVPTTAGEYPAEDARDDVAFLAAVIDEVSAQGCVDRGAVFATGYSGGGRMASALACERPDLVAAIAPVAGLRAGRAAEDDLLAVDPGTCEPGEPVSVLTFHGTADVVNPYEGNDDPRWGYSVESAVAAWGDLNSCASDAAVETEGAVTVTTRSSCADGVEVVGHVIDGASHIWPGTAADQSYFGETEWGVDASQVMWEFFAAHARAAAA